MEIHRIEVRVFCKPEDNIEAVKAGLLSLLPFDLDKEKVKINERNAVGFNERKIVILDTKIDKQRHIIQFLENLNKILTKEQKEMIKSQAESRLDDEMFFYLRFDKQRLIDKILWLTDKGDCYHIKFGVAAFPKTMENALKCVRSIF